jgi:uncharacterized protein YndB with AHSA1/START domain
VDDTRDPAIVVRERTLDAPPEEVWETLTDELALERWMAAEVELDLREGGEARFDFETGETRHARIETVRPEELLEFSWWAGDEEPGRVAFRLEPADGRTRLVVVETRGGAAPAPAWAASLTALAALHAGLVLA